MLGCKIDYDGRNPSDHFAVTLRLDVHPCTPGDVSCSNDCVKNKVCWPLVRGDILDNYRNTMESLLDSIQVPAGMIHGDKLCFCSDHVYQIENYFQSIMSVLVVADSLLPRKSPRGKRGNDFWTERLTQLKGDSVKAYDDWVSNGRPSSGPLFECKKTCHYVFKAELRKQRRCSAAEKSEAMSERLMTKDSNGFWRDWKKVSQVHVPPVNRIENAVSEPDIASLFHSHFQGIFGENATQPHQALKREFDGKFPEYR